MDETPAHRLALGADLQIARRACARCMFNETIPAIRFDAVGHCNYCALHDTMERQYPNGAAGERMFKRTVDEIRASGQGKRFDCVIGVSGGCDSSYLVYKMVQYGLRPLAVHFDNTWNSPVATRNIFALLDTLGVELSTHVVDNKEYDDIYRSFLLAGVPDIEAPTDIGLIATLYRAAEQHGLRYVFDGHSFRTEGVAPLGWLYMDGRYIRSVHRRFGTIPMHTFPNMSLSSFVRWAGLKGLRRLRPLYYLDYDKPSAMAFLSKEFGWEWYGGHHLENRFTAFFHSYFLPTRFGIDGRSLALSASVRSGHLEREKAQAILDMPQAFDPEILDLVKKRLGFDDVEFERIMNLPHLSHRDYPTYERTFRLMKPIWWALYKADRVPKSFYVKFAGGKG